MKQLVVLVITLWLFFQVQAQNTSDAGGGVLKPLMHPSLAVVIAIISIMLSVTFIILVYAKFCQRYSLDLDGDDNRQGLILSASRFSGIDEAVIESLPFFRFSSLRGSKEGLECVVCISRFEDSEILRLLPRCKHAFHKNCIDQWLKRHSSCPLCRYKLDPKDLNTFPYSNSLRYWQNPSNLTDDPNLELFVQREQDHHQGSARFNLGSSLQGGDRSKIEELLIQEGNRKILHKFKHKIIVSDVVVKNRWSDVNSSDLLALNSEMLSAMSSNRFSPSSSNSARFYKNLSAHETMDKIKKDMERKRLFESKIGRVDASNSVSTSNFISASDNEECPSKMFDPAEKRSMSEITNFSRFRELNVKNKVKESASSPKNTGKEERIRRLWMPIARRTVQWFAGRERNIQQVQLETQTSNV